MTHSSPKLTKILLTLAPFDFLLYPSFSSSARAALSLKLEEGSHTATEIIVV